MQGRSGTSSRMGFILMILQLQLAHSALWCPGEVVCCGNDSPAYLTQKLLQDGVYAEHRMAAIWLISKHCPT
jgi:hypothetical protein